MENAARNPEYAGCLGQFLQLGLFRVKMFAHCNQTALEFNWNWSEITSLRKPHARHFDPQPNLSQPLQGEATQNDSTGLNAAYIKAC